MYTVYVLQDEQGRLYKGYTNNLKRRLAEHKRGQTISTKYLKNIKVVYTESFESRELARDRELYLKSAAGRRFLKVKLSPP